MIKAAESTGHDGGAGPHSAGHGDNGHSAAPRVVRVRILRQDAPGEESYWERFEIPYVDNMNVISILQQVAARAKSRDGRRVAPVAWDCNCLEEVWNERQKKAEAGGPAKQPAYAGSAG